MKTQVRAAFGSRDFRRYFLGYATSLLGSAMAATAATFAFLDTGRGAGGLGLIMACGIVPVLLALPVSGVVADRLGARRVLLFADALRCGDRAAFAATLLAVHRPPVWVFVFFAFVEGVGDGFFFPAYSALIPRLIGPEVLTPANALLGIAKSTSSVIGPSLAGVLVAAFGSAPVLVVDAASFAVCFLALLGIPIEVPAAPAKSFRSDFREGWSVFSAHPWLWMQTVQFALFNFLVWAPFLVLGPTLAETRYGGARAWGVTMGAYGLGAVLGGGSLLRRREPRRPLIVALVTTVSFALAPGAFALGLPVPAIVALMTLCGAGTAVSGALYSSIEQRVLPSEALARVSSYNYLGAFAIGPIGLALAGPAGGALGYTRVLAFGALYHVGSCALMLALPKARTVPAAAPGQAAACPGEAERDSCQGSGPGVTVRAQG
jgi:MFS family permease